MVVSGIFQFLPLTTVGYTHKKRKEMLTGLMILWNFLHKQTQKLQFDEKLDFFLSVSVKHISYVKKKVKLVFLFMSIFGL